MSLTREKLEKILNSETVYSKEEAKVILDKFFSDITDELLSRQTRRNQSVLAKVSITNTFVDQSDQALTNKNDNRPKL